MEHRWGERIELKLPVRLVVNPGQVREAVLCDVSISGCRVDLPKTCTGRHCSEVEIIIGTGPDDDDAIHLQGCIVRRTRHGLGIEWCELLPDGVAAIMERISPPCADSLPTFRAAS